jgi:DedD protein
VPDVAPGDAGTAEDLSYPRRLEELEGKETLGTPSGGPPPAEKMSPPAPARDVPTGTTATAPAKPEPAPAPAAAASTPAPAPASPNGYVVQVAAVPTRPEADEMVKRLADKGYPAYVVEPPGSMRNPLFRVRVGGYPDRKQAQDVSRRLEEQEQFKSPWITR